MGKITPRLEKRKKWLEEKKNLSRVTRSRTAKQSSPKSTSNSSTTSTQKSKHTPSPSQTNKKSGKPAASQNNAKHEDSKIGASSHILSTSNEMSKMSRYNDNGEMSSESSDLGSKEKTAAKKSKQTYIDAVEKLENSSSIHVPKKLVLFVGNLPEDITKEQLMTHFKRAGCGVKSVKLPKYRGTDTGRGYAYVEFNSTIGHRIGLRLNNTTLAGRKIVVEFTSDGRMTEKQLLEKVKQKDDAVPKMPFDS